MTTGLKFILLCHVALFVTCNPINPAGYGLGKSLNGSEIDKKYEFDQSMYGRGGYGAVYLGHTKNEPKMYVSIKLEHGFNKEDKGTHEIGIYRYLHGKYGDLVQHHLINMVDFGKYKDNKQAIILTQTGPSLLKRESRKQFRKQPGNQPDWPKLCKLMTQVLHAVKNLHDVDVAHLDIWKLDNVVFGREPEPVKGPRLPGVTYKNDFYVLDLGNSKLLTNVANATEGGRLKDLMSIGSLLCWMLKGNATPFPDSPHKEHDIKKYFDTNQPFSTFAPEIRAALVGYHETVKELELKNLTEAQLKTAINYKILNSYFQIN